MRAFLTSNATRLAHALRMHSCCASASANALVHSASQCCKTGFRQTIKAVRCQTGLQSKDLSARNLCCKLVLVVVMADMMWQDDKAVQAVVEVLDVGVQCDLVTVPRKVARRKQPSPKRKKLTEEQLVRQGVVSNIFQQVYGREPVTPTQPVGSNVEPEALPAPPKKRRLPKLLPLFEQVAPTQVVVVPDDGVGDDPV